MSINIESFNKLINLEGEKYQKSFIINIDNISKTYKKLKKNNQYVKNIDLLWNNYNNNSKINLNYENLDFIEVAFEGNYSEYLIFIIPRITKLSKRMLDIMFPKLENLKIDNTEIDFISTESSDELIKQDLEYIQILELNINELQSKIQNISDTLLPKLGKFEENMKNNQEAINEKIKSYDSIINISKSNINNKFIEIDKIIESYKIESFKSNKKIDEKKDNIDILLTNLVTKIDNLESKFSEHQKCTKNSIVILEERISKIINLVTNTKL